MFLGLSSSLILVKATDVIKPDRQRFYFNTCLFSKLLLLTITDTFPEKTLLLAAFALAVGKLLEPSVCRHL